MTETSPDAQTFATLLEDMVTDEAPRVFAVVEVLGDRIDGRIAAWGMAFDDHVELFSIDGRSRLSMRSPESALRCFGASTHAQPHVVWIKHPTLTP